MGRFAAQTRSNIPYEGEPRGRTADRAADHPLAWRRGNRLGGTAPAALDRNHPRHHLADRILRPRRRRRALVPLVEPREGSGCFSPPPPPPPPSRGCWWGRAHARRSGGEGVWASVGGAKKKGRTWRGQGRRGGGGR